MARQIQTRLSDQVEQIADLRKVTMSLQSQMVGLQRSITLASFGVIAALIGVIGAILATG